MLEILQWCRFIQSPVTNIEGGGPLHAFPSACCMHRCHLVKLNGREACMHAQFPFTQFDRSASLLLLVVQPLPLGLDLYRTGAS